MKTVLEKVLDIVILPTVAFASTAIVGKILDCKRKKKKLSEHYFFLRTRNLININIKSNFTLCNKGKEKIFKDILTMQLSLFEEKFLEVANEVCCDPKKYNDSAELINKIEETLNNIQDKLYTYYLFDSSLTLEDMATIKVVMKKYYKWNSARIEITMNMVESICNLSFYDTPEEKMCAILDSLMVVINEMLDNSQKTLDSINGDLRGLKYKGETV